MQKIIITSLLFLSTCQTCLGMEIQEKNPTQVSSTTTETSTEKEVTYLDIIYAALEGKLTEKLVTNYVYERVNARIKKRTEYAKNNPNSYLALFYHPDFYLNKYYSGQISVNDLINGVTYTYFEQKQGEVPTAKIKNKIIHIQDIIQIVSNLYRKNSPAEKKLCLLWLVNCLIFVIEHEITHAEQYFTHGLSELHHLLDSSGTLAEFEADKGAINNIPNPYSNLEIWRICKILLDEGITPFTANSYIIRGGYIKPTAVYYYIEARCTKNWKDTNDWDYLTSEEIFPQQLFLTIQEIINQFVTTHTEKKHLLQYIPERFKIFGLDEMQQSNSLSDILEKAKKRYKNNSENITFTEPPISKKKLPPLSADFSLSIIDYLQIIKYLAKPSLSINLNSIAQETYTNYDLSVIKSILNQNIFLNAGYLVQLLTKIITTKPVNKDLLQVFLDSKPSKDCEKRYSYRFSDALLFIIIAQNPVDTALFKLVLNATNAPVYINVLFKRILANKPVAQELVKIFLGSSKSDLSSKKVLLKKVMKYDPSNKELIELCTKSIGIEQNSEKECLKWLQENAY